MADWKRSTGRFIALILRHKPETIGITLDEHGWADTDALIEGVSRTHPINKKILEEIVAEDEKQRYAFNEDHSKIRANQGHSIDVDVELQEVIPPSVLFHGTGEKYVSAIRKDGLIPKKRLYVHLSENADTAYKVGSRHGRPVVFTIQSGRMYEDGYVFYRSANGVYLTKHVPVKYFE